MKYPSRIESEVSTWPRVSVHAHRFGGKEFRFRSAEIGHIHADGLVDIPFPRAIRDVLLKEGQAERHHWVPNSGWTSFRVRSEDDVKHALWLMRISYLRYALKEARNAEQFLEDESRAFELAPRLQALLAKHGSSKTGSTQVEALAS